MNRIIAGDSRPIVLVDMDGTLADVRHRLRFIRSGRRKDWKRFFEAMDSDPPIPEIVNWVRGLSPENRVVIVTGRPEQYRPQTTAWLSRYAVPQDDILMRRDGDHRPDHVVKNEMLVSFGAARRRIAFVIDDRPTVCDMWRRAGLHCHQVGEDENSSPDYALAPNHQKHT